MIPNSAATRRSARVCARTAAARSPAGPRRRSQAAANAAPAGPSSSNSVTANAAPNCGVMAAATTSATPRALARSSPPGHHRALVVGVAADLPLGEPHRHPLLLRVQPRLVGVVLRPAGSPTASTRASPRHAARRCAEAGAIMNEAPVYGS